MRFRIMLLALLVACTSSKNIENVPEGYDADVYAKAVELAHKYIILDGHIDVPYRLEEEMQDVSQVTAKGDFDHPRAKQGGLDAAFMSIYIPARFQKTTNASKEVAENLIAMMDSIIAANPDKFAHAGTPDKVRHNFDKGLISMPYGMENGSAIEDDLSNVEYFHNKGIRYITLTHGKKNLICDSSYDPEKGWNGLSPFGEKVVAEMNRVGIIVDISHVSDSTFYQVLRLTKVPAICSHSSVRAFTPSWERNVDDDMLRALAMNGGVIQINFGSGFLTQAANEQGTEFREHRATFMEDHGITNSSDPRVEAEMERYKKEHPPEYADVETVIDHIDHVVKLVGVDHVGLGSDFDGVGDSLPTHLKSVADYPNIVYHLLKRGYAEEDIHKILGENVLRVWQKVMEYATASN
ncbi:dipeptidase [candidate division KSB1 bacterium]|nr:dipeptidase [candidate division KSB1 bacterium]TDI85479.1 MAG: membrane dipeptidase [Caldithrix sp.]